MRKLLVKPGEQQRRIVLAEEIHGGKFRKRGYALSGGNVKNCADAIDGKGQLIQIRRDRSAPKQR